MSLRAFVFRWASTELLRLRTTGTSSFDSSTAELVTTALLMLRLSASLLVDEQYSHVDFRLGIDTAALTFGGGKSIWRFSKKEKDAREETSFTGLLAGIDNIGKDWSEAVVTSIFAVQKKQL